MIQMMAREKLPKPTRPMFRFCSESVRATVAALAAGAYLRARDAQAKNWRTRSTAEYVAVRTFIFVSGSVAGKANDAYTATTLGVFLGLTKKKGKGLEATDRLRTALKCAPPLLRSEVIWSALNSTKHSHGVRRRCSRS